MKAFTGLQLRQLDELFLCNGLFELGADTRAKPCGCGRNSIAFTHHETASTAQSERGAGGLLQCSYGEMFGLLLLDSAHFWRAIDLATIHISCQGSEIFDIGFGNRQVVS